MPNLISGLRACSHVERICRVLSELPTRGLQAEFRPQLLTTIQLLRKFNCSTTRPRLITAPGNIRCYIKGSIITSYTACLSRIWEIARGFGDRFDMHECQADHSLQGSSDIKFKSTTDPNIRPSSKGTLRFGQQIRLDLN